LRTCSGGSDRFTLCATNGVRRETGKK
jgi:hypothetical protein